MAMSFQELDQANIVWQQLPIEQHLSFFVMSMDEDNKIVDVLIKMSANEQVFLHRHTAPNYMLVLSGEHRLYKADGSLKDIRPAGRYTASPADIEPHREGGGDTDVIVLFSIRSGGGSCYEVLDDDHNVVASLGWEDFKGLYAAQLESLQ